MKSISLDEIKLIELNILKRFSDYCEENNLFYVLTYGSLIGAVRHKGFIPWDDDIDVFMPRKDYNRLIEYYKNGKTIDGIELLYHTDSNDYYYPFAKLCDNRTVAKMQSSKTKHGIWVDVFPVDKIADNPIKAKKFQKHMIFLRRVIISYATDFAYQKRDWKTIPKIVLSLYGRILGGDKLVRIMEKESQKYNKTNSKLVCHSAWQAATGGIMTIEEFKDRIKMPFEQYEFYVPRSYDKFLRSLYGDYMKLPPMNKRSTHGLIAYYITEKKDSYTEE